MGIYIGTPNDIKGRIFWNAYTNINDQIESDDGYDFSREELTYIQADPRYLDYVSYHLNDLDLSPEERETEWVKAQTAHDASNATLQGPGFSTDMAGLSDDFYFVIEQSYKDLNIREPAPEPEAEIISANVPVASEAVLVEEPYNQDFALEQLGSLADEPLQPIVLSTPALKAEDAPIQVYHEIVPKEALASPVETIQAVSNSDQPAIVGTEVADTSALDRYKVQPGDSLWEIARKTYGLQAGDTVGIQNAVDHIAAIPENATLLAENAKSAHVPLNIAANHIYPEQDFILPTKEALVQPVTPLDWPALRNDTMGYNILKGDFSEIAGGQPIIARNPEASGDVKFTLGVHGSLTQTLKEAAKAQFGIELSNGEAYRDALQYAKANGIKDADAVYEGQPITITRSMFVPS